MTEPTTPPAPKPQPLRLNMQCSITVSSEEEGKAVYEEVTTFIKSIQPTAIIGASVSKLLSPCCGDKKP